MRISPKRDYFLIRIIKKDQQEKKEKVGSLYLHCNYVFLTRNMQCGELMAIGEQAAKEFPEAKVGHILIIHHFVEATDADRDNRIAEDETYNYYLVKYNNEAYGVYDGEKIIPYKDYVFLNAPEPVTFESDFKTVSDDKLTKSKGGLIVFKQWTETRPEKEKRLAELKAQIESICKSGMTPAATEAIHIKEAEMEKISREINKKKYEPFNIAYANQQLANDMNTTIKGGETVYCLNFAAQTKVEFKQKEYIVCRSEYVGCY